MMTIMADHLRLPNHPVTSHHEAHPEVPILSSAQILGKATDDIKGFAPHQRSTGDKGTVE